MRFTFASVAMLVLALTTPALGTTKKVLFVGDSITMGQYLNAYYGTQCSGTCTENFVPFPQLAATKLPALYPDFTWSVINKGVNGTTTSDWLNGTRGVASAYQTNVINVGADATVLMLGTNDSVPSGSYDTNVPPQHVSLADYVTNLQTIINYHKTASLPLVLITPPPVNDNSGNLSFTSGRTNGVTDDYANAVISLGASNGIPVVDVWSRLYGYKTTSSYNAFFYSSDGIHLSQSGHSLIFNSLLPAIQSVLGLAKAQPSLTLYKSHGVYAAYSGLEQTVMVENGMVRVWYTREEYDAAKVASNANYPFTNGSVYYRECPVAAFTAAVQSGSTIPWQNLGSCIPWHGRSYVNKGADGKYYCLAWCWGSYIGSPDNRPTQVDCYVSNTGMPGTWSLVQNGVLTSPTPPYELGNNCFFWDGSKWCVWLEYYSGSAWCISYWEGSSLTSLARIDSNASPAFSPSANGGYAVSIGTVLPQKYNGYWAAFNHDGNRVGGYGTPTDLSIYVSTSKSAGWNARKSWVLQLSSLQYFMGDTSKAFDLDSQVADGDVVEIDGYTYLFYETIWHELRDIPSLSVAYWPATLADVIAGYAPETAPLATTRLNFKRGSSRIQITRGGQRVIVKR